MKRRIIIGLMTIVTITVTIYLFLAGNKMTYYDFGSNWSPNGSQIAFYSYRDGNSEIYLMDKDGFNQKRLTNSPSRDEIPLWSPFGNELAFSSNRDNEEMNIYIMDLDGNIIRKITKGKGTYGVRGWKGDRIYYFVRDKEKDETSIHSMLTDGSEQLTIITGIKDFGTFSVSKDGKKIAYAASVIKGKENIYVINADGTGKLKLTDSSSRDRMPSISPDGTKIAFVSNRDGNNEIYIIDVDGNNMKNITNSSNAQEYFPNWTPNGNEISFDSSRKDNTTFVFIMNRDGSNVRNISGNNTDEY